MDHLDYELNYKQLYQDIWDDLFNAYGQTFPGCATDGNPHTMLKRIMEQLHFTKVELKELEVLHDSASI